MRTYKFEYTVDGVTHVETSYSMETILATRSRISKTYGIPMRDMIVYVKEYLSENYKPITK